MITKLVETKIEYDTGVYYYDELTKNICGMREIDFLNKFEKVGGNK